MLWTANFSFVGKRSEGRLQLLFLKAPPPPPQPPNPPPFTTHPHHLATATLDFGGSCERTQFPSPRGSPRSCPRCPCLFPLYLRRISALSLHNLRPKSCLTFLEASEQERWQAQCFWPGFAGGTSAVIVRDSDEAVSKSCRIARHSVEIVSIPARSMGAGQGGSPTNP